MLELDTVVKVKVEQNRSFWHSMSGSNGFSTLSVLRSTPSTIKRRQVVLGQRVRKQRQAEVESITPRIHCCRTASVNDNWITPRVGRSRVFAACNHFLSDSNDDSNRSKTTDSAARKCTRVVASARVNDRNASTIPEISSSSLSLQ